MRLDFNLNEDNNLYFLVIEVSSNQTVYTSLGSSVEMVCPHHLASSTIAWFRRKEMLQISEGAKLGVGIDKDRFSISGDHTIGDFNLQINDVMNSDFGQYVCTVVIEDTSVQIIFNLVLKSMYTWLFCYLYERRHTREKSQSWFIIKATYFFLL